MANLLRTKYDVIINGGGIVGFTLLNLLLKSPHLNRAKILLIEQSKRPSTFEQPLRDKAHQIDSDTQEQVGKLFSNRVSSITLTSKNAYKKLGIWNIVRPYAKDIKKIHVWNYDYDHKIDFRQDITLGYNNEKDERDVVFSTMENNRLSNALLENIIDKLGRAETISWSSCLNKLEESQDCGLVDVSITNEKNETQTISAPLILGCDGYKSKVRELTQMRYKEYNLRKTAVVGTVKMLSQAMNSKNEIAYQRFSSDKDTVAALLPLDDEFSSFVISAPEDYAKFLKDCDAETFIHEFNRLLSNDEVASNFLLRGIHEASNAAYDNMRALLQLIGPRLGFSDNLIDIGLEEKPSLDYLVENSRASFPLTFGTTSPRMVTSLPGVGKLQVALLGDASHKVHPLAGQGLNLGIQDALELVRQLETIAESGERIFNNGDFLVKALKMYEIKRQAFVVPMSASILAMQNLFNIAPSRMISSINKCQPVKRISVRVANGF